MTETLVETKHIDASELGERFHELYNTGHTAAILAARSIHGIGARYGRNADQAVANVRKGQAQIDPVHYAVLDEAGDVWGGASAYFELPLAKSLFPLPGAVARRTAKIPFMYTEYPYAMPNIQAWVADGKEDLLPVAYAGLFEQHKPGLVNKGFEGTLIKRPWTCEVMTSDRKMFAAQYAAHDAIEASGLIRVMTGWFDDGETVKSLIPCSVLYTAPTNGYDTWIGRLKELRTGKLPGLGDYDDSISTQVSHNPIG